jgi:ABC-type nitrate/sulfonate/bicarbonate transport system permease component
MIGASLKRVRLPAAVVPWLVPLGLLLAWHIAAESGWLSSRILPAPLDIGRAFLTLTASGELWRHLAISLNRALAGFAVGGLIGLALGFATGTSPVAEKLLDTSMQMVRNVPHLALTPLVILWFGIGEEAKLFLIALGVMFPIYLNTFHGIRSVDRQLIEMGRTYGLGRWALLREVILPGALPSILVGVRFALGVMWLTLIVAETIAANSGIGYMAMNAREFLQTDVVVLAILLYALLGKLADVLAKTLERRWLGWHPNFQLAR